MATIQSIRDSRVEAHAKALEAMDLGMLFTALVETSAMVGMYLADKWNGTYDVERTHNYLKIMAQHQLRLIRPFPKKAADDIDRLDVGPTTDGLGSASAAAGFGAREFTNQDARTWELQWSHNTGHDARAEHVDMDGVIVPAQTGFDVDPGLGAPGCGCTIEPINPSTILAPTEIGLRELERLAMEYKKLATESKYGGKWYRTALRGFQEHSWDLQAALREGKNLTGLEKIMGLPAKSRVRWLDEAIEKGKFADDTVVYRGTAFDPKLTGRLQVGDKFIDPAYTSTTVSETVAKGFVRDGGKLLEIHVPAGTNAAFLGQQFAKQSLGEILLPRGMQFEIKQVLGDRIIVEVVAKGAGVVERGVVPKVAERIAAKVEETRKFRQMSSVRDCEKFIDQRIKDVGGEFPNTNLSFVLKNGSRYYDMDLKMANEVAKAIDEIAVKSPAMLKKVTGLRMEDRFGKGTYAWVSGMLRGKITLEARSFSGFSRFGRSFDDLVQSLSRDAAGGYHPAEGIESILSHEMGHVYFGTFPGQEIVDMLREGAEMMRAAGFDTWTVDALANPQLAARFISRYAEQNLAEFTAELTSAVVTGVGERYVRNLAGKEFVKIMRQVYRRRGLIP